MGDEIEDNVDKDVEYTVIFGQDLDHCDAHCYEEQGFEKWRCINPDHVENKKCQEDWLHCKICFKVIENATGNNQYCEDHQADFLKEQAEKKEAK